VVGFPKAAINISSKNVHASFRTHPPSYSVSGRGLFLLGVKRSGPEGDQLSPPTVNVRNEWSYTSTPSMCLHGMGSDL
jgi:hypothetical protein